MTGTGNPIGGVTWQPGQQTSQGGVAPPAPIGGGSASPAKLFSLRLPNRQAPNTVAPLSLLQGSGMAGAAPQAGPVGFLQLLQHLLRGGGGTGASDQGRWPDVFGSGAKVSYNPGGPAAPPFYLPGAAPPTTTSRKSQIGGGMMPTDPIYTGKSGGGGMMPTDPIYTGGHQTPFSY